MTLSHQHSQSSSAWEKRSTGRKKHQFKFLALSLICWFGESSASSAPASQQNPAPQSLPSSSCQQQTRYCGMLRRNKYFLPISYKTLIFSSKHWKINCITICYRVIEASNTFASFFKRLLKRACFFKTSIRCTTTYSTERKAIKQSSFIRWLFRNFDHMTLKELLHILQRVYATGTQEERKAQCQA